MGEVDVLIGILGLLQPLAEVFHTSHRLTLVHGHFAKQLLNWIPDDLVALMGGNQFEDICTVSTGQWLWRTVAR